MVTTFDLNSTVRTALQADLPLMIFGKSGWGKTEVIREESSKLGLETFTLSLALSLPEDIGGIPSPSSCRTHFTYLLPEWFESRKDKDFVLFLDEVNQAAPQTLHAIYSLVQERRLHSVTNKKMRVIAAGNFAEENPHLTDVMQPLLNRFYVVNHGHDPENALTYLNNKYKLSLKELENSPRDTEQGIIAYKAGLKDLAISKAGMSVINAIEKRGHSSADELIQGAKTQKVKDRNGFLVT